MGEKAGSDPCSMRFRKRRRKVVDGVLSAKGSRGAGEIVEFDWRYCTGGSLPVSTRLFLHGGGELRGVLLVSIPAEATEPDTRTALLREHTRQR